MNGEVHGMDPSPDQAASNCWNNIGVQGDRSCEKLAAYIHCRNCPAFTRAAVGFLNTALTANHLRQYTEQVAQENKSETEVDRISVVVFRIDSEWFGLPTAILKEIVSIRPVHAVPHRRNGILRGLANIGGELLPCFSLQTVLGLNNTTTVEQTGKSTGSGDRLLVLQRDRDRAVCAVSEVHGIVHFFPRDITSTPATIARASASYTRSTLNWRETLIGLLNDELLFKTVNRSLA